MFKTRNLVKGNIPASRIKKAYEKAFNVSPPGFWERLLMAITGQGWQSLFFFADNYYKETDEKLIRQILKEDETALEKYVPEFFDCDDHTFRLMGAFHQNRETAAMPIFITWVMTPRGGHALLSYYVDGKVKLIEPQNDKIFLVPEGWELILLCG